MGEEVGEFVKRLVRLAQKIKDERLRKRVVRFLQDPRLSHPEFKKYPRMPIEKARVLFAVGGPQTMAVERDVLRHTTTLVDLCIKTATTIQKNLGISLNRDHLIAAALLHDLMKIFEWKEGPEGTEPTGVMLDHTMLAVAELYRRGFPEEVIHIVAAHFGQTGPTPPRSFEALILHYLDSLLSMTEYHLYAAAKPPQPVPLIFIDERALKKLSETEE
jgi:7,8-dihydroneopterin 2',3'-cyclic phosphate phosphodiesterase